MDFVRRFRGEYVQKLDGKGRMSVPAEFRRALEQGDPDWTDGLNPRLVVLYGDHLKDSLHVYTLSEFAKIEAGILALPRGSENRRQLSRLILGQSLSTEVDKDGRVIIPIRQRNKIGLEEGEVYFSGAGDHFEIWRAETFSETEGKSTSAWLSGKPDNFDPLILLDPDSGG